MEQISLETRLKEIIENLKNGKLDKEIISFTDFKSQYAFLKNQVIVHVTLTNGKEAKIDITDYFYKGGK